MDISKHLIYTTLTVNSTTFYTYENYQLIRTINNLNCSEIISQDLGLINASKTLVGFFLITTDASVINTNLVLYFMKKSLANSDGSRDLITVVTICNSKVNKTLVLSILKKIMDKYINFRQDMENSSELSPDKMKAKLGEFKLYMNQIIKFEEMNYETNKNAYNYGSINNLEDQSGANENVVISPSSLLLANEEVEEVRQLMLDNINKIMTRGDKINLLVDQTDRLQTSSSVFQRKTQQIRRTMWFGNIKLKLMIFGSIALVIYILLGSGCGFPILSQCI